MEKYFKNKQGEWWYQATSNKKIKAKVFTCKFCKVEFPRANYNPTSTYCSRTCSNRDNAEKVAKQKMGEKNYAWKGGRVKNKDGYIKINKPDHPNRDSHNLVLEHRYVMEQKIGRLLTRNETVHHINGVRDDNRPENLELFCSQHPPGQRVKDLVKWAKEILFRYGDLET